eukprot:COSAG06_NODE_27347_length_595_cov_0.582661_1_plen_26_part_01
MEDVFVGGCMCCLVATLTAIWWLPLV